VPTATATVPPLSPRLTLAASAPPPPRSYGSRRMERRKDGKVEKWRGRKMMRKRWADD
jgi:hypothetical protein